MSLTDGPNIQSSDIFKIDEYIIMIDENSLANENNLSYKILFPRNKNQNLKGNETNGRKHDY